MITMFGMNGETKVKTHTFKTKLTPSVDKPTVDLTLYRYIIGTLLYLTSSRPDIMFDVCYYARYQANPREPHMLAVKNNFRYLRRTTSLGLWYPSNTGFFIQSYLHADLGGMYFIGKPQYEDANFWMESLLVRNQRNKHVFQCLLHKLDIFLLLLAHHK